ncbi:MAG: hypothetical protein PHN47_00060 [Clostridia bacterium]|jgi:hypothetical protein|nr:hypothetical protein [Clostridia bacterium]MDD4570874.1 hypothetical protein [Clostridia bacterium]
MEALFAKMQEYLQMDSEIPFPEFCDYYKQVTDLLTAEFADIDKEGLLKMAGVCHIVSINAAARGSRKDANSKKFKKMADKTKFWYDAIRYKLNKDMAMSVPEIDEALENLWA